MATGFFVLPPELRLKIYHQAVTTSMASGKISDVSGLLFSCHKIYNEMTADYISHVRPVLEAMNKWRIGHPARAPVKIELPKYNFHKSPTEAEISIPYSSLWEWEDARPMTYGQPWSHGRNCAAAFEDLLPMMRLPWVSLIIRVHFLSTDPVPIQTDVHTSTWHVFVLALSIIAQDSTSPSRAVFPKLEVLVLCFDNCQDLSTKEGRNLVFDLAYSVYPKLQRIWRKDWFVIPKRWATKKTQDGRVSWEMNFDLENWISKWKYSI